jgi:spore coat protein H
MKTFVQFRTRLAAGVLLVALLAVAMVVPAAAQPRPSTATPAPILTADDLFDQSVVRDLRLTMRASDWDALVEHYLEDTYYRADMEWQGQVVPIVGVRSRGSGSRNPYKPGLKIAFAQYVDQRFLGLKSVVLVNAIQDPSMLRQRASMAFFTRMGVPAPRVTHVRVFINDQYLGLYMLFEPVDKTFLARIFGPDEQGKAQNTGFLYDYAWKDGYGFEYLGSDLQIYAELFEADTRETEAPSVIWGPLESLFKDISEAADGDFERVVGAQLDLAKFVRFIAVENFLADRDSILGHWGANNFYYYRFASSRPAEFIAWDKDLAFWAHDYDIYQGVEANVLARRVLSIPRFGRLYLEALMACAAAASEPVSEDSATGWFEAQVQLMAAQIRAPGLADEHKPYSNERFEDELQKVLAFPRNRAAFVAHEAGKELAEGRLFR